MLAKGSTAIDGLAGSARVDLCWAAVGTEPVATRYTRTDRAMFFSCCSPRSSKIEAAGGILLHARGDADAAGLSQALQTGCHVDAITEDVTVLDHDVALVNPDAELDAVVGRLGRVAFSHAGLHLGCTAQRIHHTAELDEQAIAGCLHEPTIVRGDCRIEQFGPDRLERSERAFLVCSNQPLVTRDISRQDRGQSAGCGHNSSGIPALRRPAK